jgi:hypothetical protein
VLGAQPVGQSLHLFRFGEIQCVPGRGPAVWPRFGVDLCRSGLEPVGPPAEQDDVEAICGAVSRVLFFASRMPAASLTVPVAVIRAPKADTTSVARASVQAENHCVPASPIAGVLSERLAAESTMLLVVGVSALPISAP